MEPLKLHLIKQIEFNEKDTINFPVILLFSTLILVSIYVVVKVSVVLSFILAIALIFLYRYVVRDITKSTLKKGVKKLDPEQAIGSIRFFNDKMEIEPKQSAPVTIQYTDIASLVLDHNKHKGFSYPNSIALLFSGGCTFQITTKDGHTEKHLFVLENEKEFNSFMEILKTWNKQGIDILERSCTTEDRTILFRSDWTYEQLQDIKKELGIEDFYKKRFT